jgi:hypothetical protein
VVPENLTTNSNLSLLRINFELLQENGMNRLSMLKWIGFLSVGFRRSKSHFRYSGQ